MQLIAAGLSVVPHALHYLLAWKAAENRREEIRQHGEIRREEIRQQGESRRAEIVQ